MLIYGNTPRDIMRMIWRKKFKLLTIIVVIAVAVMLMGCTIGNKKISPPLQALDKFWKTLGSDENQTNKIQSTVE